MAGMTTAIPTWTLADRLVKARHHVGMNQGELAQVLGIGRRTVSRYEDGEPTKRAIVLAWAMATGVDPDWLEHGIEPGDGPDDPRSGVDGAVSDWYPHDPVPRIGGLYVVEDHIEDAARAA